jgi:anti-sigma factor RsiW
MRCSDVLRNLNSDTGDLDAVRRHLESCPECSRRFAGDLEIEEALRNLGVEIGRVDITPEVSHSLGLLKRRRSRFRLFRRWVWAVTSVAVLMLLMIATPILAGWLGHVVDFAKRHDARSIVYAVSPAISSMQLFHMFCLMVAVLALLAAYLWREARRTVS